MDNVAVTDTWTTVTDMPSNDGHSLTSNDIVGIVMYVVIGVFGIIGNTLVMIVFGLLTKQKTQVNIFIFDQALIDACTSVLLILFGVVNAFRPKIMMYETNVNDMGHESTLIYGNLSQGETPIPGRFIYISETTAEFLCRFWWSRFFLFASFAISTWNLTVMSIERYFAVLHPMSYPRYFSKRHAITMIVAIWFVSPFFQYVPAIFQYTRGQGGCFIQDSWSTTGGVVLGVTLFVWELVIPVCIMAFVYLKIFLTMRRKRHALRAKRRLEQPSFTSSPLVSLRKRAVTSKFVHPSRNITVTLFILFAVYVVCWTPNQITFLQFNFGGPLDFTGAWYNFTVCLAFINCCVNPFIYALRLQKFQKGMRRLVLCQWRQKPKSESRARTKLTESTSFNGLDPRPDSLITTERPSSVQQ